MDHVTIIAAVLSVALLLTVVSGCTVIIPESQNLPQNATQTRASDTNSTVSVQSRGERQRYGLNPLVSYGAKDGYKLALYEVIVTTSTERWKRAALHFSHLQLITEPCTMQC